MIEQSTSGPWRVQDGAYARRTSNFDRTYRLAVLGPAKNGSSPTVGYGVGEWGGEGTANAHVIAAAPDLLAVCREALPLIEEYLQGAPELADRMRDAIKKAEGQS